MKSITEEMRFLQRLCEYALKYGVKRAARRYHTNRQFVYRQLKKYDGDVRSLALKSRKPHKSPNAHNEEELGLIRRMLNVMVYMVLQKYMWDAREMDTQEVLEVCVNKYERGAI